MESGDHEDTGSSAESGVIFMYVCMISTYLLISVDSLYG
jgi:hypothetical protein